MSSEYSQTYVCPGCGRSHTFPSPVCILAASQKECLCGLPIYLAVNNETREQTMYYPKGAYGEFQCECCAKSFNELITNLQLIISSMSYSVHVFYCPQCQTPRVVILPNKLLEGELEAQGIGYPEIDIDDLFDLEDSAFVEAVRQKTIDYIRFKDQQKPKTKKSSTKLSDLLAKQEAEVEKISTLGPIPEGEGVLDFLKCLRNAKAPFPPWAK